jgi:hypothetical protein
MVKHLVKVITIAIILIFSSQILPCQVIFKEPLSPRIANYKIWAKLDTKKKGVEGREILHWTNTSEDEIKELQFHLYMNAFKNSMSTFMKESSGRHRGFKLMAAQWGWIEIKSIKIKDGEQELTSAITYIQPDDNNPYDQTVMKVSLPEPIRPDNSIEMEIEFYTQFPSVFARTGFWQNFFMAGQWFPKIGVYQKGGWNCHQFHVNSEFFADYGTYDVYLTVPEDYVVGATGLLQGKPEINKNKTKTCYYRAEDVHDFAWTAWPEYKTAKDTYNNINITFLYPPNIENHVKRHLKALKYAIKYYGEWYGKYPYPNVTMIAPAIQASGAGGMEYPTLFTTMDIPGLPAGFLLGEMVTIHEFGHNYWQGLVGSNEFEEAWLDEGINSYSTAKVLRKAYGIDTSMLNFKHVKGGIIAMERMSFLGRQNFDPLYRWSWKYYDGASYSATSYNKGTLMLMTLEGYLGEKLMNKVMSTYFERWKFKHPTTQDFIAVANEVSGQDLNWFFDQVVFGTGVLDYAVQKVKSDLTPKIEGNFNGLTPLEKPTEGIYHSEVAVRRIGEVTFPVELLVTFENGEEVREKWNGSSRWKIFNYEKPSPIKYAQIDPDKKVFLDVNFLNNSMRREAQKEIPLKLAAKCHYLIQSLLHLISSIS